VKHLRLKKKKKTGYEPKITGQKNKGKETWRRIGCRHSRWSAVHTALKSKTGKTTTMALKRQKPTWSAMEKEKNKTRKLLGVGVHGGLQQVSSRKKKGRVRPRRRRGEG